MNYFKQLVVALVNITIWIVGAHVWAAIAGGDPEHYLLLIVAGCVAFESARDTVGKGEVRNG